MPTTISGGDTRLAKPTSGYAVPGNITITDPYQSWIDLDSDQPINPSATVIFNSTLGVDFSLDGHNVTVAAISASNGVGVIQNAVSGAGYGLATFTVNGTGSCSYNAGIHDHWYDDSVLAFVKDGSGTLTLLGGGVGGYTGGLTVRNGLLDYSGGSCPTAITPLPAER